MENYAAAIADIVEGARLAPLWLSLGWQQTIARFRRTILGPFWLSVNLIVIGFAMTFVFGGMAAGGANALLPKLLSGLLTWSVLGAPVAEATGVFISAGPMMTAQKVPLSFHVYLMMFRAFINFVAQLLALWMIFLLLRVGSVPTWPILFTLPLILINSFLMSLIVAVPSTRFRDVNQLFVFLLQIMFFITPVFWAPDQMTKRYRFILDYNPFAHYLELVRAPLLGRIPALIHLEWTLASILILSLVAIILLALYRKRIVFWL